MKDEEFFAKLLVTFRLEAEEHLKNLSTGLMALETDHLPDDQRKQTIETIFREMHSLKGAARAVGQQAIEKICQALENVFAAWKQDRLQPSPELFDNLYAVLEVIRPALSEPPNQQTVSLTIERLKETALKHAKESSPSEVHSSLEVSANKEKKEINVETSQQTTSFPLSEQVTESGAVESKPKAIAKEILQEKFIRASLSKMNQLFQEAEEMLMVKLIVQKQVANLKQFLLRQSTQEKELSQLFSEIQILRRSLQEGKVNYSNYQETVHKILIFLDLQQQNMKSSKKNLNQLIQISEQNTHFVESMVDTLLEDMKKVLMQPMNILFETMPPMIRNIARELGKEIHVEFEGSDIEVDRRVLEEIKDPLIHLVRNAIDHGVEHPEERIKNHKPSFGTIKIMAVESEGNSVNILIVDDGKGMNFTKLKESAIRQNLLSQKDALEMKNEDILKLAFQSGISTSATVTELSGRGLGLGIVLEKIDRLGGKVIVESKVNEGTTFKLNLPLTLATFRGIHLTVADQDFIMPTQNVKRVLRIKEKDIQTVANHKTITIDNHSIPFIDLTDLLGIQKKEEKTTGFMFALLVSAIEKTIAFGVSAVHAEQEVLVKSLGKQCIRVKNIMAATVMEGGNVMTILNPVDLVRSALKEKMIKPQVAEAKVTAIQKEEKEILLVEDSITTRLLLKHILESMGYKVKTAVDGVEALEIIQAQSIDLLLTDIEMPRMDGFTLIEKIKQIAALKEIPILICSARGSQEDRERGIALGVNAYLDKRSFTQQDLINILKKLL